MSRKETIGGRTSRNLPFSKAYRAGDFIFVSGQVPADEKGRLVEGGIDVQTRQVLRNIESILAQADCGLDDVVKTTVWLDDVRDFSLFNKVYQEFFPGDLPARSTVRADLMVDAKIEMEAVAYKPQ